MKHSSVVIAILAFTLVTATNGQTTTFSNTFDFDRGPVFEYNLNATHLVGKATLSKAVGWMGVGWGPGQMVGSETVIGQVSSGNAGVVQYSLQSKSSSGVQPATTNSVTDGAFTVEGEISVLQFVIPIDFGSVTILPNADNNMIWAYGAGELSYHTDRNVETVLLSATGTSTDTAAVTNPSTAAATYNNTVQLDSMGPILDYTLNATHLNARATLDQAVGWMGIGFGPGTMVGSEAVIGQVASGNAGVVQYSLNGESSQGVQPTDINTVTSGTFVVNDTTSILSFVIPLAFGDPGVLPNEVNQLVWAYGAGELSYHSNRAVSSTTLVSADNTVDPTTSSVASPSPSPTSSDVPNADSTSTSCTSSDPAFGSEITVSPGVTFAWNIVDGNLEGKAVVSQLVGWLGIGFGTEASSMVPADAVVGQMEPQTVQIYALTSRSSNGVQPDADNSVTNGTIEQDNAGTTTMTFTIPLRTIPSYNQGQDIFLIWAFGDGNIAYHGQNRGSSTVNLITCFASTTTSVINRTYLYIHGIFMSLAWLFFVPAAVFSSAFRPFFAKISPNAGMWWFHYHRIFNTLGLFLATVAFGFAFTLVADGLNFTEPHHIIGLTVMIIAWLQPLNAFVRPHVPLEDQKKPLLRTLWEVCHKGLGYSALILAVVNCGLGLDVAFAAEWLYIVYGVWVGLAVGTYIILFVSVNFRSSLPQQEEQRIQSINCEVSKTSDTVGESALTSTQNIKS
eukprot:CFRG7383T1